MKQFRFISGDLATVTATEWQGWDLNGVRVRAFFLC